MSDTERELRAAYDRWADETDPNEKWNLDVHVHALVAHLDEECRRHAHARANQAEIITRLETKLSQAEAEKDRAFEAGREKKPEWVDDWAYKSYADWAKKERAG